GYGHSGCYLDRTTADHLGNDRSDNIATGGLVRKNSDTGKYKCVFQCDVPLIDKGLGVTSQYCFNIIGSDLRQGKADGQGDYVLDPENLAVAFVNDSQFCKGLGSSQEFDPGEYRPPGSKDPVAGLYTVRKILRTGSSGLVFLILKSEVGWLQ